MTNRKQTIMVTLEADTADKLDRLCAITGLGRDAALAQAIDCYFGLLQQPAQGDHSAAEIFRRSGFLGSGETEPRLSSRAKEGAERVVRERFGR